MRNRPLLLIVAAASGAICLALVVTIAVTGNAQRTQTAPVAVSQAPFAPQLDAPGASGGSAARRSGPATSAGTRTLTASETVVPGFVVARVATSTTDAQVARAAGVKPSAVKRFGENHRVIEVPKGRTERDLLQALDGSDVASSADLFRRRYPTYTPPSYSAPTDPYFTGTAKLPYTPAGQFRTPAMWWLGANGLDAISYWQKGLTGGAPGTHGLRASGSTVRVAVIDSGFYTNHPDRGTIVGKRDMFQSYNPATGMLTRDNDVTPPSWTGAIFDTNASYPWHVRVMQAKTSVAHGTMTAGEIGAASRNGVGVTGAGWDTQVYVYKVMGVMTSTVKDSSGNVVFHQGEAWMPDVVIADAIRQAANDGCKVINLSLGGPGFSQDLEDAVTYAHGKGALVVAATGNDGRVASSANAFYPAAATHALGVGAYTIDAAGTKSPASFSNTGYGLDVFGPGEWIVGLSNPSDDIDNYSDANGSYVGSLYTTGYGWWDGTSMASPAVAAGAAWLWRAVPGLTNDQVAAAIVANATPGAAGPYANIPVAYDALVAAYPTLSPTTVSAPAVSTSRTFGISWSRPSNAIGAVSYDASVDGATAIGATTQLSGSVTASRDGTVTVQVRPTSLLNWFDASSAGTAQVLVDTVPTSIRAFGYGNDTLTWVDTESGMPHTTTLEIDGSVMPASGNEFRTTGLAEGSHEATLTITDAGGRTAVAHRSFTIDRALVSDAVDILSSYAKTITYPQSTTISARGLKGLSASSIGGFVIWESSTNAGTSWSYAGSAATTATSSSLVVKPSVTTWYRSRVPGAAASAPIRVSVRAKLSTPYAASTVRKGRSTTISGRVEPKHAAGSVAGTVRIERRVGSTYRLERSATVKTANGTSWSLSWKPKATGRYRISITHADTAHTSARSSYRYTTSK